MSKENRKKTVLFVGSKLFGYYNQIITELERRGYKVDFYPERNDYINSFVSFFKNRLNILNRLYRIHEYYILNSIKSRRYDLFLLIRGERISADFVKEIKDKHLKKHGETVYYSWDSSLNLKNSLNIRGLFDRSYTFDSEDAEAYKDWRFLPLFYSDAYKIDGNNQSNEYIWDLGIVASFTEIRFDMVRKLKKDGFKIFSHLFLKRYLVIKQILFNKNYREKYYKLIKCNSLSQDEIVCIYKKCKSVLDLPSTTQTGLSMRTIECIGMKKKLVTSNQNIANYDFYNESNIFILNSNTQKHDLEKWINKEYEDINPQILENYSIQNWVERILNDEIA